ncbi:MAG: permease-like cell division protein FtsX [Miniphocaeibacter sp.]|uniref:permease-like cell division protein FtsX n=1 Tax=Miniphocaeibacter sp. TaxID=3100973 RepID=UPI001799052B|nr:ABC transporter permease [Gallicola sp.]
MRKIRVFFATLKEGIKSLWKHRGMGFASVLSIMLALIILGVILISALTLNQYVLDLEKKVDEVVVYMDKDSEQAVIDSLKTDLENDKFVKDIRFKSSEEALKEYTKSIGESQSYLLEGMEGALPPSYVVTLNDVRDAEEFSHEATNYEGVSEVIFFKDTIEKVVKISHYVQIGGAVGVVALVIISIFIISNTIKLTVFARKREIQIKKYIGATNTVITGPFIVEGAVFGLIGSGLAFAAIYFGYDLLFKRFAEKFQQNLAGYLIPIELIYKDILIIFLTLGIGIGIIGSLMSIRKYLKV